jgi:CxxC motif-containing protein (DUF1111 family)
MTARLLLASFVLGIVLLGCDAAGEPGDPVEDVALAGGATTVFSFNSNAFSTPAPNLSAAGLALHLEGDVAFEAAFVTAPAPVNGGLGPIFNQNACIACHARDGRSRASLLLRLSLDGEEAHGAPRPVPGFGGQLQDRAVYGYAPEGRVAVTYTERVETLVDGTMVTLRAPQYAVTDPYQPLPEGVRVSPRVARPVFGLGLLEAVPEAAIRALAGAQAAAGVVSGRPNEVWDAIEGRVRIGRFGWKANQPSLLHQNATAYHEDMGVTSVPFPVESGHGQPGHTDGHEDEPEVPADELAAATFYTRTLGVPARRSPGDPEVRRGEALFRRLQCAACHVPRLETGTLDGVPEVSNQVIFPYTDLLLHDLGEGLADGRTDFLASGTEWRTPPLWGIGLAEVVNGELQLLHDGRARSFEEAILWHGGEAEAAREGYRRLSRGERDDLAAFLRSL